MNPLDSLSTIGKSWLDFWFGAQPGVQERLALVRVATCSLIGVWLASFLTQSSFWFGPDGVVDARLASLMINFEESSRWQHWSPLWLSESNQWLTAWLSLGILLSLMGALGIGGRATLGGLALITIGWLHRIVWLQGPFGPLAIGVLLVLCFPASRPLFSKRSEQPPVPINQDLANLAVRLIQSHWFIVFSAGLLTQLAGLTWWQGEAMWWLVAEGKTIGLTMDTVSGHPLLINFLTHSMLGFQLLGLWLLTTNSARFLGVCCAVVASLLIAMLGGQVFYGLLLASISLVFLPFPENKLA